MNMMIRDHIKTYGGSELYNVHASSSFAVQGDNMIVPFICVHGLSGIGECFRSLIQGHRVKMEQSSELSERVVIHHTI